MIIRKIKVLFLRSSLLKVYINSYILLHKKELVVFLERVSDFENKFDAYEFLVINYSYF